MKTPQLNQIAKAVKYIYQNQTIGNTMSDQSQAQNSPTLEVDGVSYLINSLSGDIQELIAAYQSWERELNEQKLATFKTEAAMRAVSAEIQTRVRNQIAAAKAQEQESTPANDDAVDAIDLAALANGSGE